MPEAQSPAPLILIASEGEWVGRSLENVLESNGYTVLRVESGRRALELARRTRPDALLLDDSLPDVSAVEVCRALQNDPLFDHATPILVTAAAQHASRVRTEAYEAGAWDYCTIPLDVETLLAKLGTFIRASHEVEARRSKNLVDRLTGLYSQHALEQWMEQLGARALRKHEPMACVVVSPDVGTGREATLTEEESREALAEITELCRSRSRRSDVVAYLGDSRVAIVTPDTNVKGVERLIERLREGLATNPAARGATSRRTAALHAGYCAVPDFAAANLSANEIVLRAQTALEHASRIRLDAPTAANFDTVLPS